MGVIDFQAERPTYLPPTRIASRHRLDAFDCGKPPLDDWLKAHALDNEGKASRTYVVAASKGAHAGEVVAYYSLATGGVARNAIHRKYRQNLPNPVPVMVVGRLAVDRRHHGCGLGRGLLREAVQRTLQISQTAGVRMLLVHAIDDEAVAFYLRYGFHAFPAGSRTLFLPIETIAAAL